MKTSSQAAVQETSSQMPRSATWLAREGRLTSRKALETTPVNPTFLESSSWYADTSMLLSTKTTSKNRTPARLNQTQGIISSSIIPPSMILPTDDASAHLMHTSLPSLRSINMELTTAATSVPSYSRQAPAQATRSRDIPGTSFAKIYDSDGIPPMGQLKTSRYFAMSASDIKATPSIASYHNDTLGTKETGAAKQTASTGLYQTEQEVHATQSEDVTPSKTSDVVTFATSVPSYLRQAPAQATRSRDIPGTSFAKIYDSDGIPPMGQLKTSRYFAMSASDIKATPSIASYHNDTLGTKETGAAKQTASTGLYQTEQEVHATQSEDVTPSKTSDVVTFATSVPSYSRQAPAQATRSRDIPGTSFAKIYDSDGIPPMGQLKTSRYFAMSASDIKATPSIASYHNDTLGTKETGAAKQTASTGLYQTEQEVHATQSEDVTPSKTSDVVTFATSVPSYSRQAPAQATRSRDIPGTSFAKIYDSDGIPPMGQLKTSRYFAMSASDIKATPSIASYHNDTLGAKETGAAKQTASTGLYQTEQEVHATQSEDVTPSKRSDVVTFGPKTTPVEQTTTQYPPVIVTGSPLKGRSKTYFTVMIRFINTGKSHTLKNTNKNKYTAV